jgi:hypothetical protein
LECFFFFLEEEEGAGDAPRVWWLAIGAALGFLVLVNGLA